MSASPKAELVFRYRLDDTGIYTGSVEVVDEQVGDSMRVPLGVALRRPEWVRFVVSTIRRHKDIDKVVFAFPREGESEHRHQLSDRTVAQIKDEATRPESLIL